MTTYRVLLSARFKDEDGVETCADSMHLVDGVESADAAEGVARADALRSGVEVVGVRVMEEWRRRRTDRPLSN